VPRELDEDDVRVRAGRSSRPRTKKRPAHAQATPGVVTAVDRGRYTCEVSTGTVVVAVRAREMGRRSVIVGDQVQLTGDLSGTPGSLARIVRTEPRVSTLRRSADDISAAERPIVANAEQLAIVVAASSPAPRQGFVDRALVAAYDAGIDPVLVITKNDLADPTPFLAAYRDLDIPVYRIEPEADLAELRSALADRSTVLVGPSGVGKSTLVNRLVPRAERATGKVNAVTGRGRHTSTSAVMMDLPGGGTIIDTPGLRSFGLRHVEPDSVVNAFADLAGGLDECPRGCDHENPECALDQWCEEGHAPPARLHSLRRILHTLNEPTDNGPAHQRR